MANQNGTLNFTVNGDEFTMHPYTNVFPVTLLFKINAAQRYGKIEEAGMLFVEKVTELCFINYSEQLTFQGYTQDKFIPWWDAFMKANIEYTEAQEAIAAEADRLLKEIEEM